MSTSLGEVVVRFVADTAGLNAGVAAAASQIRGFGQQIAAAGVVAGITMVGIGIASVKMAADFQQSMTRLQTGAGDATDNMQTLGQGILDVSTSTGVLTGGTKGLSAAMYQIVSSGERGAQALDTLKAAAQGAQIEQANVVDVAKILSGVITDYGSKTYNATQYMNGFVAAVAHGKITLEDLSTAMGPIMPLAAQYGVSFADLASAMTTMTNAAIPATRASTGLRFLLQSLEVPTVKASNAFKQWGVDTSVLADKMRTSLPDALEYIYNKALVAGPAMSAPFNAAVSDMIGGQRALGAFLALTGTHLDEYKRNTDEVTRAMGASRDAVKGWDVAQQNFNIKLDEAKATGEAFLIMLGARMLPAVTAMLDGISKSVKSFGEWATASGGLADAFVNVVKWVQALFTELNNNGSLTTFVAILKQVGDIVGGVVTIALEILATVFGTTAEKAGVMAGGVSGAANAIQILLAAVQAILAPIRAVVQAFEQQNAAGFALRSMIISLATAFLVFKAASLVSSMIALTVSFVQGAVAAYGFAVALWASVAPAIALSVPLWAVIAVVAAVALAIVGIILVIQHWGDIMDWLSGKSEETAKRIEADKLKEAADVDLSKIQANNNKWVALEQDKQKQLAIIRGNGSVEDKATAQKTYDADIAAQKRYNDQSIALAKDREAKLAELQKTPEGRNTILAQQQKDNNALEKDDNAHMQRLLLTRKELSARYAAANSDDERANIRHLQKLNDDDIAATNKRIQNEHDAYQKRKAAIDQNNKDIEANNKNFWQRLTDASVNAANQIDARLTAAWKDISKNVGEGFKNFGDNVGPMFTRSFASVGKSFSDLGTNIRGFLTTVKNDVGGAFSWIGIKAGEGVSTVLRFFNDLPSKIGGILSGFVNIVKSLFIGLWHDLVGGSIVPDMINGIVANFASLPGRTLGIIAGWIGQVIGQFNSMLSQVTGVISRLPGIVGSFLSQAAGVAAAGAASVVNNVISQIATIGGRVAGALGSLSGIVGGALASAAGAAWSGALNIGESIAAGLWAAWGDVVAAASSIAGAISGYLPHSPAKEGPLKDLDKSMPAMINLLTSGMYAGTPKIKNAMSALMAPASLSTVGRPTLLGMGASAGSGDIHVHIEIGGREVMQAILSEADKTVRARYGNRSRA